MFNRLTTVAVFSLSIYLTGCQVQQGNQPAAQPGVSAAIRVKAGTTQPVTDAQGNKWLKDQGFTGGMTVARGNVAIANTQMPEIYRTERYGMTAFSRPVPNGAYTVKLHFCETFDEITDKGMRVFNVDVEGTKIDKLDVFAESGGLRKALVKTVKVDVKDGKLDIKFAP